MWSRDVEGLGFSVSPTGNVDAADVRTVLLGGCFSACLGGGGVVKVSVEVSILLRIFRPAGLLALMPNPEAPCCKP